MNTLECPLCMLGNQRVGTGGGEFQGGKILTRPSISQRHTYIPQESRALDALDRGLGEQRAEAVVIGRSMIVGKPMALLLVSKNSNATVTIAHSRSKDLPGICRRADILITAVGRPEMVKADWIKPGAVVIDVGINRVTDASKKSGYRLTGDVAYEEVAPLCSAITPVPGGVGPMTIAMLMKNTLQAARQIGA